MYFSIGSRIGDEKFQALALAFFIGLEEFIKYL